MTDRTISPPVSPRWQPRPGSPMRRRMTEDMTVRGFTASTQRGYIRAVGNFTAFFAQLEVLSGKSRVKSRYVSTPLRAP